MVRHAPFRGAPLRQWASDNYPELGNVNVDKGWLMWYIVQAECERRSPERGLRADQWLASSVRTVPPWLAPYIGAALFAAHNAGAPSWMLHEEDA